MYNIFAKYGQFIVAHMVCVDEFISQSKQKRSYISSAMQWMIEEYDFDCFATKAPTHEEKAEKKSPIFVLHNRHEGGRDHPIVLHVNVYVIPGIC